MGRRRARINDDGDERPRDDDSNRGENLRSVVLSSVVAASHRASRRGGRWRQARRHRPRLPGAAPCVRSARRAPLLPRRPRAQAQVLGRREVPLGHAGVRAQRGSPRLTQVEGRPLHAAGWRAPAAT